EQRSWGTQPPNMSMTPVANPRTPGPPREPQPINDPTPTTTMAINPCPLTTAPPYGRQSRSDGGRRRARQARRPQSVRLRSKQQSSTTDDGYCDCWDPRARLIG